MASGAIDLRVQIKKKGEVGPSIRCNASHSLAPGSFIQKGANFGCKTGCHGRLIRREKKFCVTKKPRRESSMKPSKEGNEELSSKA